MKIYSDPFSREGPVSPEAPVVLVSGPNGGNRGDQLMMRAVADHWAGRVRFPPPMMLRVPLEHLRSPRNAALMGSDLFGRFRHRLRYGAPSVLLDCSGYQYADPWAHLLPLFQLRLRLYRRLIRQGARLVLLPQSFGPFQHPELRACCQELLGMAERIYAREPESMEALSRELGISDDVITPAPDFTSLVKGAEAVDPEACKTKVLLIPNRQMVAKQPDRLEPYLALFVHAAERIQAAGFQPVVLLHDDGDRSIAASIAGRCRPELPIVDVDAVQAKGLIRCCRGVLASRYHALISALSQGIPAVGTSWSHKYVSLFDGYGVSDCLMQDLEDRSALDRALECLLAEDAHSRLAARISQAADQQRQLSIQMWAELDESLAIPLR